MYRAGDLSIKYGRNCETCYADDDDACEHPRSVYDRRPGNNLDAPSPALALPHSCDSWIIGGLPQALQLMADLADAMKKLGWTP